MQTTTTYRPEVIRESPTQYAVSSQSDITRWYAVTLEAGHATSCTCPAGEHGKRCKHAVIAEVQSAADNAPKPLPQPIYGTCVNCGRGYYTIDPDAPCSCGKSRTVKEQAPEARPIERHQWGTFRPAPDYFQQVSGRSGRL